MNENGNNKEKNLKILTRIKVTPLVHNELINESNERGVDMTYFAGWILEDAIDQGMHKLDGKNRKIFWKGRKLAQIKWDRDIVKTAALNYLMYPTEEGADLLAEMCDDVGLNYDEVLGDIEDDKFAELRMIQDSVFIERAEWLYTLLDENGGKLTVRYIRSRGEEFGYTKDTLNKIKNFMNEQGDLPKIVSAKTGSQWVWKLQDPAEKG